MVVKAVKKKGKVVSPFKSPTIGNLQIQSRVSPGGVRMFKKGGMVKKTGIAKIHKGEMVVPKKKVKKVKKAMKRQFNEKAYESARKKAFGIK